ncbi:MAG: ABC transporter ATP-binding protein [Chloroflexota bacterium]
MSDVAISVEGLGKRYRIGHMAAYGTLRDSLAGAATYPFRRFRGEPGAIGGDGSPRRGEVWALRDLSFTLKHGEILGIIGRNGAGKSTLLKVLSRITRPTEGRAEIHGRIGSLLEVGTGFHPELTGRENIYLSGAILGMRKAEIARKFDEIVAFAEVEKFLDTPVKRYSSGMYVRLAFAVAAHLETEILLVDEVLAVGDAEFQGKCVGRMGKVAREGRTILFVSHNMGTIRSLCRRVVLLEGGRPVADGGSQDVTSEYLASFFDVGAEARWSGPEGPGNLDVRLTGVRVHAAGVEPGDPFPSDEAIQVEMGLVAKTAHPCLQVGFDLLTRDGTVVFRSCHNDLLGEGAPRVRLGANRLSCSIPRGLLNRGGYYVCPRIGLDGMYWIVQSDPVARFEVGPPRGSLPVRETAASSRPGVVAPLLEWTEVR